MRLFEQETSRDIEYVAFQIVPSEQDIQLTEEDMNKVYEEFKTATDLKQWYEVKEHTKTINGRSVACMTIIRTKFMRIDVPGQQAE